MLKVVWHGICDLVYPPQCLLCRKGLLRTPVQTNLCLACIQSVSFNRPPFCLKCSASAVAFDEHGHCRRCRDHTLHFDRAWSICLYNDTMRHLIHQFKYGHKLGLRKEFAEWILSFAQNYHLDLLNYDLIVPIPLHPARLRERGYNQSQLIAETIAQKLSVPVSTDLRRTRHTPFQARCSQKQRWTNISGAFKMKHSESYSNRSILIVDDLMTTGATVSEVARTLKQAGACRVDVITLAAAELN